MEVKHEIYKRQYRRCNKSSCTICKQGPGHGSYWYAYGRDSAGRVRSRYIGIQQPLEVAGPPIGQRVFIYALCDPDLWQEARYIGVSGDPRQRLVQHLSAAHRGEKTPKGRWLRALQAKHLAPVLIILEETRAANPFYLERTWIQHYRQQGARLTNVIPKAA